MNIKKPTAYAEALITESMEQRLLMAHLRCPSTIRSLYAILSLPKQYRSAQMTRILFICHGNILRSLEKACYINGFHRSDGAYYTTITPFTKEL